jgi:hypothetical protein
MDINTIILLVIGAELMLGCIYLRRIVWTLERRATPIDTASVSRSAKPRAPTIPDRPSSKLARAIEAPLEIEASDILGVPTDEELRWSGTHDLDTADLAEVVEHETEFYDFGASLQATIDAEEDSRALESMIEEELKRPESAGRLPSHGTEYATRIAIGDKVIFLVD